MKAILLAVLGLAVIAAARPDTDDHVTVTDIKQRQILILKLLNHVLEPCMYKDIEDLGKNFQFEENIDLFTKTDVVKKFVNLIKVGTLPRGEIFTLFAVRQLEEVVTMFHVLYYAKDFTTFIKAASWMRLYLNEGMFVYALTVAVRHREDCKGIILPPPYEIYPYYFVRGDVIQKAYWLKMKQGLLDPKLCDFYGIRKTDKNIYIIDENVYDTRVYLNADDKLRYFTEDIDLNTYFYYFHVDHPFWMRDNVYNKLNSRRYELIMYIHQQILARYYLERLSNGLGDIKVLSWYRPIKTGYWPWMKLHNGVDLPVRFNNYVTVRDNNVLVATLIETYENIIKEAITKGFVEINGVRLELTKPDDLETLGKLIYGKVDKLDIHKTNVEAYRYLMVIVRACLGLNFFDSDKYFVVPNTLDMYQTALRDPVFYQLQKRIHGYVLLFKVRLPSYTREELYFPGVKIDNIVVDKLVTYFDDFLMDMTNAVVLTNDELKKTTSDMGILVRKRRLNHQPFQVSMDIISDKSVDCVVRVFLGPKHDELGNLIDINKNRFNFVELDSFIYKLVTGKNTILRKSTDMHNLVRDRMFTRDLWKKIETVTDMKDMFKKEFRNWHTGFPTRLLLPKGRVGGLNMMLYVIVSPLKLVENVDLNILDITRKDMLMDFRSTTLLDKMPLGFPFDRVIDVTKFITPNMKFLDVTIFHKKMVCDMKTRWNRYVLGNYGVFNWSSVNRDVDYLIDTDIHTTIDKTNVNVYDF